ncbi:fasciclin domain-containing protein [Phocaeicola plebeius]|uniref:fasciclin domain-containing protein n=1 Tax=Phocaeicola plebeius TaxID=310297 RepID=UPI0029422C70|nr:fasciclin domain-containing protein [Phocaeicola plebeius]
MKTLTYYLLGIFSLCLLNACSDEDNPTPEPPPSKGQEEVQKIVEVLESQTEISQFVDMLKQVDVADLNENQLTVFAVKNPNTASRTAQLDSASIKNHIVKGRYAKEDLTDGSTLTSISNETLYVTRTENDVLINGVKIEGNAIPAGNSYVYVVPEVIPMIEAPATYKHQTTIIVKELIAKNYPSLPLLAEVTIEAKDGSNQPVGTFKTNTEGSVVISHNCDTLIYRLQKTDYADLNDGWIYAGTLDENGNYMYKDLNGDAKLDINDKVNNIEWPYQVIYEKDAQEVNSIHEHFMVPVEKTEEISRVLEQTWAAYTQNLLELNKQLLTGEGGFSYDDVAVVSERYWDAVIQTRMSLTELQTTLVEAGEETSPLNEEISMKLQEINLNFYEYYGQTPFYGAEEEFIEQLQLFADSFTQDNARKILRWLAEIYLLKEEWQRAADSAAEQTDAESKLILAIANQKLQNETQALQYLNQARTLLVQESETITSLEGKVLIETCHFYGGVSNPYPYYRILNEEINCYEKVEGFTTGKNHLLPVPQKALDAGIYNLRQNNDY